MTNLYLIFSLFSVLLFISKFYGTLSIAVAASATSSKKSTLKLTERNFQIAFLNEVRSNAEHMALRQLNEFLEQLKPNTKNSAYVVALNEAIQTNELADKVLFIKQYLDVENLPDDGDAATAELEIIALRNVNFLSKLDKQLREIQDASIKELRQFRMFQLCKQFREKSGGVLITTFKPPYAIRQTKLAAIDGVQKVVAADDVQPSLMSIELDKFGRMLYERVNAAGAEIIDDYLLSLRNLLQEVIVDKHDHEKDSSKLSKLLDEIDIIVGTADFYEKRQKLYTYLEESLAVDYEQFKSSEHGQEDLAEILNKLRERGLDLFVTFLFSNFEFLECLHKELAQLLPPPPEKVASYSSAATVRYDEATRLLYDVISSYSDFKRDSENNEKYEAYLVPVKALYNRTSNLGDDGHIFELLHNASLNVGSVTLNMIRAKCDEI